MMWRFSKRLELIAAVLAVLALLNLVTGHPRSAVSSAVVAVVFFIWKLRVDKQV